MGLDVYCTWLNMTKEEQCAQITGFSPNGKAGYLRQSWGSLRIWDYVFKEIFGLSWHEMLYPGWNGCNDGYGPDLTDPAERERLQKNLERLMAYIQHPIVPEKLIKILRKKSKKDDDDLENLIQNFQKAIVDECGQMSDFIGLALSKEGAKISFC